MNDVDRTHYFTGRSDGFDPTQLSTTRRRTVRHGGHPRLEDLRRVFISDEYGPYVYEFDRLSGSRVRAFTLPKKFAIANLNAWATLKSAETRSAG